MTDPKKMSENELLEELDRHLDKIAIDCIYELCKREMDKNGNIIVNNSDPIHLYRSQGAIKLLQKALKIIKA